MKLTLYDETNFNIRWFWLDLGRVVPVGMNGANADFATSRSTRAITAEILSASRQANSAARTNWSVRAS